MKNRKKADTYRFNGVWGMEPVLIDELQIAVNYYARKLRSRYNSDAPGWTARWLLRFERELEKKQRSREDRQAERTKQRRKSKPLPPPNPSLLTPSVGGL